MLGSGRKACRERYEFTEIAAPITA